VKATHIALPLAAGLLGVTCATAPARRPGPAPKVALRTVADFADLGEDTARGQALFTELGRVLTHPRCVNCHPAADRPLQGERGQPHQPLAVRGRDGHGVAGMGCTTCHGATNFESVPGDPHWRLAPIEMAWEGKSLGEICAQLKDPLRNGGRTLAEVLHHMAEDSLVGYGWSPPPHLEPAPGDQASAAALFAAWMEAGAPCPE